MYFITNECHVLWRISLILLAIQFKVGAQELPTISPSAVEVTSSTPSTTPTKIIVSLQPSLRPTLGKNIFSLELQGAKKEF